MQHNEWKPVAIHRAEKVHEKIKMMIKIQHEIFTHYTFNMFDLIQEVQETDSNLEPLFVGSLSNKLHHYSI